MYISVLYIMLAAVALGNPLAEARSYVTSGSFALVSQKSLMLFTKLSNAVNCTGLQR